MNRKEIQYRILQAYDRIVEDRAGNGRVERLHGYEQAVRHRTKFESCGRVLTSPYGCEVTHWCRRPACPTCATFWGRKLGSALVAACPDAAPDDYRMATLILGLVPRPEDAFDQFWAWRRSLGNAIDYRRRAAGIDRAGWRGFGAAGSLELDQFEAEEFLRLGTNKQAQYRALGFEPERAWGPQWVTTVHALVHVGTLGDDTVRTFFQGAAPVVHLQGLREDKDFIESAEDILGYAAKVSIVTTLSGGETRPWSPDAIASYVAATMQSHGRQGFKVLIRPKGPRKKSTVESALSYLAPMPIII